MVAMKARRRLYKELANFADIVGGGQTSNKGSMFKFTMTATRRHPEPKPHLSVSGKITHPGHLDKAIIAEFSHVVIWNTISNNNLRK
jgi:ubiquitin-protein ligase